MKIINTLKKFSIILICMLLIDFCLLIFSIIYYFIKYKCYTHPIGIIFIISIIGTICLSFISSKHHNKYNLKIEFFLGLFSLLLFVFSLMTILMLYEMHNALALLIEFTMLYVLLAFIIIIEKFKEENN